MKKALLFAAGALMAASSSFAAATELYAIGSPFGGWTETAGEKMTSTEAGVFTIDVNCAGTEYFAFTEMLGSWTDINGHRYAPAVKDTEAKAGEELKMEYGVDASWKILPGDYTFTVNTNTMILTVTEKGSTEKVYSYGLKGQLDGLTDNDWKEYTMTQVGEDADKWEMKYTPTVSGGQFGMMQLINGSQSDWYSAGVAFDADMTSAALTGEPAGNCTFDFPANKEYVFTFTVSTKTLSIVPAEEGSVEGIVAEEGTPVFYNLQGVEVANPENGLFIKVVNGKAVKVAL